MTYKAMILIHLLCMNLKDRADIEDNELFYKGTIESKNGIIWNYLPYINIKWIRDIVTVFFSFKK